MSQESNKVARLITVRGLVQGVGFRPFVYRLAKENNINGWAKNSNHALTIHAEGLLANIEIFSALLKDKNPQISRIDDFIVDSTLLNNYEEFIIDKSENVSDAVTHVSPDIAVCDECIHDMFIDKNRIKYSLINCTNCGPRFSIVQNIPYDRHNTTMSTFKMCDNCHSEYIEVANRRFHAQPIACNNCGPKYKLYCKDGNIDDIDSILETLILRLKEGKIFSFKGTGGFHLVCNAKKEEAVKHLRWVKHRDTKPFAVMFGSIEVLKQYAYCNEVEEKELLSFRRPVVILKEKISLASSVSLGLGTIGAMLPYMPFHHLLFEKSGLEVLVMTSGNMSDEPIIIDNQLAINSFLSETEGILAYDRDIYNRTDDSVVFVVNNKTRIVRRSRGYVPQPLDIKSDTEGIFAAGAELTGTYCIGKGTEIIGSQYFGDLQNIENFNFYTESYDRFKTLFRFQPKIVVSDLHPDYASTTFAKTQQHDFQQVQHHFAHIASVMAENQIDGPIIGVAFDGTGYGTDGNIWGSEFMVCTTKNFERKYHFEYIPLPGGDKVILEPWRTAMAYLNKYLGKKLYDLNIPFLKKLDRNKTDILLQSISKGINAPLSCSVGRLFDAVAALTDVCTNPTFHAEAPMRLEAIVDCKCIESYSYRFNNELIVFEPMLFELISDIEKGISKSIISAKFHNTVINVVVDTCIRIFENTGIHEVALSGGSFQNKYLLENIENQLIEKGFTIYVNERYPSNDGGIALGQLYLIAKNR